MHNSNKENGWPVNESRSAIFKAASWISCRGRVETALVRDKREKDAWCVGSGAGVAE